MRHISRLIIWALALLFSSPYAERPAADLRAQLETLLKAPASSVATTPKPDECSDKSMSLSAQVEPDGALTVLLSAVGTHATNCLRKATDLVLFVDHVPIAGLAPASRQSWPPAQAFMPERRSVRLEYRLRSGSLPAAISAELMGRVWRQDARHPVSVGLGFSKSLLEDVSTTQGVILDWGGFGWIGPCSAWVMGGVAAGLLLMLGRHSSALKDRQANSSSLSRLLLAAWMLTALAALLLFYGQTGVLPTLADNSALWWMLSIAGFTATAAPAIEAVRPAWSSMLDAMAGGPAPPVALPAAQPVSKPTGLSRITKPYQDLLTDDDGLALHRAQALLFHLSALILVWIDLAQTGRIVAVDASWFKLLSVSSATYLFGKATEKKT